MHRIDGPGATVDSKFTEGDPAAATPATTVTDDWLNAVQEEIAAVIESTGTALDKAANGQLLAAITSKISAAIPTNVPQGVRGAFSNLRLSATGSSAVVSVAADELTVVSALPAHRSLQALSLSINSTALGANGLDSGTLAASTWYSVWVVWNGATAAGLLSLSASAPTLPGGYTHKARIGWIRTDATANKYPVAFVQSGRAVQYKVSQVIASGVAGSVAVPTWVSVGLASVVPATAGRASIGLTTGAGATNTGAMAHPNSSAEAITSNKNPPMISVSSAGTAPVWVNSTVSMALESTSIYWASGLSAAAMYCFGWEDNL